MKKILAPLALILHGATSEPCTICFDGSPVTRPNKVIRVPEVDLETTCGALDFFTPSAFPDESASECDTMRRLSTVCGCPRPILDSCMLCPDGSTVVNITAELDVFSGVFTGFVPTCELMEAYMHWYSRESDYCRQVQVKAAEICGCPAITDDLVVPLGEINGTGGDNIFDRGIHSGNSTIPPLDTEISIVHFFGHSTEAELRRQYRVLRSSATLSVVGALLVLQDNLRNPERLRNVYNQIVSLMSLFDILFSAAFALLDIPRPKDDVLITFGERGNRGTCVVQGWIIQLGGMTSLFLNASLSVYYVLVVVHNYRESKLNKVRKWLLGIPIFLGVAVAFASIPFVAYGAHICHLSPPTSTFVDGFQGIGTTTWAPVLSLYIGPGYVVIVLATLAILRVYCFVRRIDKKTRRCPNPVGNPPGGNTNETQTRPNNSLLQRRQKSPNLSQRQTKLSRLRSEVFWQSLYYLLALYCSWFIYLSISININAIFTRSYKLWTFIFFIIPLQGFLNSGIYFLPRLMRWTKDLIEGWRGYQEHARNERHLSSDGAAPVSSRVLPFSFETVYVEPVADLIELNRQDSDESGATPESESARRGNISNGLGSESSVWNVEEIIEMSGRRIANHGPPPPIRATHGDMLVDLDDFDPLSSATD